MSQHNNQDGNHHFPSQHNFKIASTDAPTGEQPLYQSAALQRQAGTIQHPHVSMTSQSLGKRSSMGDPNEQLIYKRPRNINFQQPYPQQISSGYISNNLSYTSDPGPARRNIQGYSTLPLMPPGIPGNTPQSSNLQNFLLAIYKPTYQSPYTNSTPPSVKQKPKARSMSPSIMPARQPDQPRRNRRSPSTTQPVIGNEPASYCRFPHKECRVKSSEHTACNRVGNGIGNDTPLTSEENELYWILHEELYGPPPAKQTSVSVSAYPPYPLNHAPNNYLAGRQLPTPQGITQNGYVNGIDLPHTSPEFQARSLNDSTHNRQQRQILQSTHMGTQAHEVNPHPEFRQAQLHHITQTPQTATTGQSGYATSTIRKSLCQSGSMVKEEVEPQGKQNPPSHCDDMNEGITPSVKEINSTGCHEIQNGQQTQGRASSLADRQSDVTPEAQNVSRQQPENYAQQRPAKRARGLPLTFTPGFRENLKWVYTGFHNEPHSNDNGSYKAITYSSGTVAGAVNLLNTIWNDEQAYTSELGATMGKWIPK